MSDVVREKTPVDNDTFTDILNQFDLEDLDESFNDQIDSKDPDMDYSRNLFKTIYDSYKNIIDEYDFNSSDRQILDDKFEKVCCMLIDKIARKFNFTVNYEIENELTKNKAFVAMCLYEFFINDYIDIARSILVNYILANYKDISSVHDTYKNKKDSATIHYKDTMEIPPEFCVIISNIVNISEWIFDRFETNEEFLNYIGKIESDYLLDGTIFAFCNEGFIEGSFVQRYAEIFRDSLTLKGKVALDVCNILLNKIKKHAF